jgi:hypothetical protein
LNGIALQLHCHLNLIFANRSLIEWERRKRQREKMKNSKKATLLVEEAECPNQERKGREGDERENATVAKKMRPKERRTLLCYLSEEITTWQEVHDE